MNDYLGPLVGEASYGGHTTVHPLGIFAVIILSLFVLFLSRSWTVIPFLVMACSVSSAQRIVIAGMDFDFLRILVVVGVIRSLFRKEHLSFVWNSLDKAMILWTISAIVFHLIQHGTMASLINRLGIGLDALGMYFLFRFWIRDYSVMDRIVLGCILISIPEAVFFLVENRTGQNMFSIFGGVPEFTVVRDGRLRCQGPFTHAILAGCFWASTIPIIFSYYWKDKSKTKKLLANIGLVASLVIIYCCASSTPVLGVGVGLIGAYSFVLRRHMRLIRWFSAFSLVVLHIVMKAPVWHLVSRVSAVGGSTGWHRYNLINQTIMHFGDWWLTGCSTYTVATWGIWAGDITNHYILQGVKGGIVTLILFIAIIVIAFSYVGKLWRLWSGESYKLAISWALGVSLFTQCTMFIGVSYYGQIYVIWYLLLAAIGSLSNLSVKKTSALK